MKKISILIPCYNEEKNIVAISKAISEEVEKNLSSYDYEIIFIDNNSKDNTRSLIREVCRFNTKIKAILNAKNFGQFNSPYYGLQQTTGDCTILLCCDFQDPIEMIPELVRAWEEGAKIVSCIKTQSEENKVIRFLRTLYYKTIKKLSDVEQIEHFTGFGLYDKSFIEILRNLNDPTPFLRGIVAELGYKRVSIEYTQAKRRAGKTHNNFFTLLDAAMLSFTSYTKCGVRLATYIGVFLTFLSSIYIFGCCVYNFSIKEFEELATCLSFAGLYFIGGLQMILIGFLGEYILNINARIKNRPLVVEEERINF